MFMLLYVLSVVVSLIGLVYSHLYDNNLTIPELVGYLFISVLPIINIVIAAIYVIENTEGKVIIKRFK